MLLEASLSHADGARRAALGWALSIPWLRKVVVDKDRRVAAHAVLLVTTAALLAIGLPSVPLVVAPLVLGVPHLASEARWLVVRARVTRRWQIGLACAALALAGLAVARRPGAECALGLSGIALALACSARVGARGRAAALLALVPGAGAVASALSEPFACAVRDALIATHGLVTLGVWIFVFRRAPRFALPAVAAVAVGVVAVGALRGSLVALAFLASVHYAVWLVLVPSDAARGAGTPTFRMSVVGWRKDLGGPFLALIGAACVLVAILVLAHGAAPARDLYLVAARFHLWLEAAMACLLVTARRSAATA